MTLPAFVIIGAMKAGSTSLFRWLGAHPDVRLPEEKEPNFFSRDANWRRGLTWYEGLFPASEALLTGEASVHYTDPDAGARAARRLRAVLPGMKLIFLARDPVERLRSHYRHEVQRGREKRSLVSALRAGDSRYVRCSRYTVMLQPWLDAFPRTQLFTLCFESLVERAEGWDETLAFLGLSSIPRPDRAHNVTAEKRGFSPVMRKLFELGAAKHEHLVPTWAKQLVKPILFRTGRDYQKLLSSSNDPLPDAVTAELEEDYARFQSTIGWGSGVPAAETR